MDGHWLEQARHRLVADQQCDHRKDDGAGEAGEIAELAGAEGEARIVDMTTRIGVGQCRKQQRAGMRAHVQPVGDQRDGAEQRDPPVISATIIAVHSQITAQVLRSLFS